MARGVNKAIIVGNLGHDPEVRQSTNGDPFVTLNVATSDAWQDKVTGEQKERTEWHRIVFFRRLAEITAQYLKKGSKVYVEGSIRTRKWQDQAGTDRYTTEIIADNMQMLDSKPSQASYQPSKISANTQDNSTVLSRNKLNAPTETNNTEKIFDDNDIPF